MADDSDSTVLSSGDDDFEQDSEEYQKWRQGNDNDKYASSRTPTTTASTSYSPPQPEGGGSNTERNMDVFAAIAVILIILSGIFGIYLYMKNAEEVANWPTTDGKIIETYYIDGWEEKCEEDSDGYEYCEEVFFCEIKVTYNYAVAGSNHTDDEIIPGSSGESRCQEDLESAYVLNATVTVHYNPDNVEESYIKNPPIGAEIAIFFCCIPIVIVVIILAIFSQVMGYNNYSSIGSGYRNSSGNFFGSGRGFGRRMRRGGRRRSSSRRSVRTRSRKR